MTEVKDTPKRSMTQEATNGPAGGVLDVKHCLFTYTVSACMFMSTSHKHND